MLAAQPTLMALCGLAYNTIRVRADDARTYCTVLLVGTD